MNVVFPTMRLINGGEIWTTVHLRALNEGETILRFQLKSSNITSSTSVVC